MLTSFVSGHWCSLSLTPCSVLGQAVTAAAVRGSTGIPKQYQEGESRANKQGAELKIPPSVRCFVTNTSVIAVMLLIYCFYLPDRQRLLVINLWGF